MDNLSDALESILEDWRAHSARYKHLAQQAAANGDKEDSAYYETKHLTTHDHILRIAIVLKEYGYPSEAKP